jgi:hypothetical protein
MEKTKRWFGGARLRSKATCGDKPGLRLCCEVHHAGAEIVHGADDLDGAFLLQILEYGTATPYIFYGKSDIGSRHGVDIGKILA